MKTIEIIITSLIALTILFTFLPKETKITEPEIQDYFDDYPLEYWRDTDDGVSAKSKFVESYV